MNTEQMILLSQKLVMLSLTNDTAERERLTKEIAALAELTEGAESNEKTVCCGLLKFTDKEISKMPKTLRKEFRVEGCTAHVRKRCDDRYQCSYEIRYRRNGYNVTASARTLEEAKQKFIEKLHHADKQKKNAKVGSEIPTTYKEFSLYYFQNFRFRKVAEETKRKTLQMFNLYLLPAFNEQPLKSINVTDCQKLIDDIFEQGKKRTAVECFSILSQTLKMAVKHGVIYRNPCDIVFLQKYERQHGHALTKEEEIKLLKENAETPYQTMFAVALYTGMRPNEYKTAVIDGNFIKCVNSKQKDGKIHYKRIPITPMLKPYLDGITELKFYSYNYLVTKMKESCPTHRLYDLRTTFYTRCQECGVAEVARNLFVGHSLAGLAKTYTDVSDEYLLREAEKLKY